MQRRELVSMLPFAAAAAVAPAASAADEAAQSSLLPQTYESFADWLESSRASALQYLRIFGTGDTERFMKFLALWACAMPDAPDPDWQPVEGANRRLEMATIAPGRPFVVSAFRMAPGCVLPTHCHPGGGGVTICTSGAVALQHFELCEGSPPFSQTGAEAQVRQVQVADLRRNEVTLFTPTLANLHQLRAGPEGATGVDIAVQWQGAGEFSFLRLHEDVPAESFIAGRHLRGDWTGMQIATAYPR